MPLSRSATEATIPEDLRAAIEANPRARKTFRTLGRQNLFALALRTKNMKTPPGAEEDPKTGELTGLLEESLVRRQPDDSDRQGAGSRSADHAARRPPGRDD